MLMPYNPMWWKSNFSNCLPFFVHDWSQLFVFCLHFYFIFESSCDVYIEIEHPRERITYKNIWMKNSDENPQTMQNVRFYLSSRWIQIDDFAESQVFVLLLVLYGFYCYSVLSVNRFHVFGFGCSQSARKMQYNQETHSNKKKAIR